MKNIEDFLKKFKIIKDPSRNKEDIIAIIKAHCGCVVDKNNLTLQGKKLIIQAHPTVKNLIYLKKETLLEQLKINNPEVVIDTIV